MAEAGGKAVVPRSGGSSDPGKEFRARQGIPIVPSFDGFRAVAILGIVLLHLISVYGQPSSRTALISTFGALPNLIDILFILSGFVVFLPTVARAGEFGSVAAYAIRRAARLMPAFWLAIAIVVLMIALWPAAPAPEAPSGAEVVLHAVGLHQPAILVEPDFLVGLGIDGPMWTLSLEVTFYLLLPFIAAVYFRHPLLGLLAALVITVGWKLGAENAASIANWLGLSPTPERILSVRLNALGQFPAWAFHFALGMTAAWAMVRLRQRYSSEWLARRAVWVQGLSLAALLPLFYQFGTFAEQNTPLAPTLARTDILLTLAIPVAITLFMLSTALAPPRLQVPFAHPRVRALGDISYGIYLIHFPLVLLIGTIALTSGWLSTSFWVLSPIVVVASVAYGYISGRFLEQPIRRWAHRFGRRAQPAPSKVAAEASEA